MLAIILASWLATRFAGRRNSSPSRRRDLLSSAELAAVQSWFQNNQQTQTTDVAWARYGLECGSASPRRDLAAASVGNLGYFSERPIVDLLGKTDQPSVACSTTPYGLLDAPGHCAGIIATALSLFNPTGRRKLFQPTRSDIADGRGCRATSSSSTSNLDERASCVPTPTSRSRPDTSTRRRATVPSRPLPDQSRCRWFLPTIIR